VTSQPSAEEQALSKVTLKNQAIRNLEQEKIALENTQKTLSD
jgi:hypothetical protein